VFTIENRFAGHDPPDVRYFGLCGRRTDTRAIAAARARVPESDAEKPNRYREVGGGTREGDS
jgi:hypothetical protein